MEPNGGMQVREKDGICTHLYITFITSKILPLICVQKDNWNFMLLNVYVPLQQAKGDIGKCNYKQLVGQ